MRLGPQIVVAEIYTAMENGVYAVDAEEAARKEAEATIAVAEALTLLEKGAARAELREMAPRPRPGAVSGERAWKIE